MSTPNLYGSICLTDIPKELIQVGKNGKKYLPVNISARRTPSQYGHTHYIKVAAKKGAVSADTNLYIGDLKPSEFQPDGQATPAPTARPTPPPPADDDLPF